MSIEAQLQALIDAVAANTKAVELNIHTDMLSPAWLNQFQETLQPWKNGAVPVVINYTKEGAAGRLTLGDEWRVNPSDDLMLALETQLGSSNVKIVFN